MVLIRPYRSADRSAVRKIFQDTAFLGDSHQNFFNEGEWLADFMTPGYIDPDSEVSTDASFLATFVAEEEGRVVGYLMGTSNTDACRERWKRVVLPLVVSGFFFKGVWKSLSAWKFFYNGFQSTLRGEEQLPKGLFTDFPAHFHINMDEHHRSSGLGGLLAQAFFKFLRERKVSGVHVRTASPEPRQKFFQSLGFQPLLIKPLTLWNYKKKTPYFLITYGLLLTQ